MVCNFWKNFPVFSIIFLFFEISSFSLSFFLSLTNILWNSVTTFRHRSYQTDVKSSHIGQQSSRAVCCRRLMFSFFFQQRSDKDCRGKINLYSPGFTKKIMCNCIYSLKYTNYSIRKNKMWKARSEEVSWMHFEWKKLRYISKTHLGVSLWLIRVCQKKKHCK